MDSAACTNLGIFWEGSWSFSDWTQQTPQDLSLSELWLWFSNHYHPVLKIASTQLVRECRWENQPYNFEFEDVKNRQLSSFSKNPLSTYYTRKPLFDGDEQDVYMSNQQIQRLYLSGYANVKDTASRCYYSNPLYSAVNIGSRSKG